MVHRPNNGSGSSTSFPLTPYHIKALNNFTFLEMASRTSIRGIWGSDRSTSCTISPPTRIFNATKPEIPSGEIEDLSDNCEDVCRKSPRERYWYIYNIYYPVSSLFLLLQTVFTWDRTILFPSNYIVERRGDYYYLKRYTSVTLSLSLSLSLCL